MSHRPRKRFGQNFLRDERTINAIIAAISPRTGEHLVEIGPGEGVLTRRLLPECGKMDVIELDRDLVTYLNSVFSGAEKLTVHSADALSFDFLSLYQGEPLRIIGNLPYNVSTPLLFHLFEQSVGIRDMHFMLQKEVVDRLCAEPGEKEYGKLGVMARYFCDMEPLVEVGPECFYPRPKVTSSVVRLIPHAHSPVQIGPQSLGRVVGEAFSQRRKTLRNSLRTLLTEREISSLGIDPGARAETLSLEDFALLGEFIEGKRNAE